MKKLKILMICSEYPPDGAGIATSVKAAAESLYKNGHQVTVLTRGRLWDSSTYTVNGVRVCKVKFIPFFPPFHVLIHEIFINHRVKSLIQGGDNFDIAHIHSPLSPLPKIHIPLVATAHSTWRNEARRFIKIRDPYDMYVLLFSRIFVWLENRSFKNADVITATSTSVLLELINDYNIIKDKIHIVPNQLSNITSKPLPKNHKYDVISVSRLVQRKGIVDLLDAIAIVKKSIPTVKVGIVGSGPLEDQLREIVNKYGLANNVSFLGHINHESVTSEMGLSKLFVSTARYEPFGLTTLEAMATGIPVIATKTGGSSELIRHSETGLLVEIGSPTSIANGITMLLNKPQLARKISISAKEEVNKLYNPKRVTAMFEIIYRSASTERPVK